MFFYLLYNSNLINEYENKLNKLIIYGIVLYIVLHILINNMSSKTYLGYYFWIIFILDCLSISSLVITESNGNLLINNIKNINQKMDNIIKEKNKIKPFEKNLNKETDTDNNDNDDNNDNNENDNDDNNDTDNNININNENEFNRFIEELNRVDTIDKSSDDNKILDEINTQRDEREIIMDSLKRDNTKADIKMDSDIEIDINDFDDFIQ